MLVLLLICQIIENTLLTGPIKGSINRGKQSLGIQLKMNFILILTMALMVSSQLVSTFSIMVSRILSIIQGKISELLLQFQNRFPTRLTFYTTGMNNFQNRLNEFSSFYGYRGVKRNVDPNDKHLCMQRNAPTSCF